MTLEFNVPNMACSACATTITNAVTSIDSTATVDADLKTKRVKIDTQQPEATVKEEIVAAGHTVT
ncbi:heavy-metal-associated domain-containing protein [Phormidium sp. CLA17]|nr:heavy-metal-associated domain-containing protein [Leptolyngbya sp. Cla-17]